MRSYLWLNKSRAFDGKVVNWDTKVLQVEQDSVFFVQVSRKGGIFMFDVVMKGTKEDCKEFVVEASILDAVSGKSMFKASFQPRWGGQCSNVQL